ncbi:MAG: S-layer homology domain-containing protein [Clostridia bacterium]|nr:S-layer homology domain-containing protein [Clostridia bacterium]
MKSGIKPIVYVLLMVVMGIMLFSVGCSADDTDMAHPLSNIPESDYVIMSFAGENNSVLLSDFNTKEAAGDFSYVENYNGRRCAMLNYHNGINWSVRVSTRFTDGGRIGGGERCDYPYMVLVYAAKSKVNVNVLAFVPGVDENVFFVQNSKVSGEWSAAMCTEPVTANLAKRLNAANTVTIRMNAADHKNAPLSDVDALYIRELVFFKNRSDAESFANTAPIYYNSDTLEEAAASDATKRSGVHNVSYSAINEPPVSNDTMTDGEEAEKSPIILDFTTGLTLSVTGSLVDIPADNAEGNYRFTTLTDGTKCLEVGYSEYKGLEGYRFMPAVGASSRSAEYKYVRVTYMADNAVGAQIRLRNNAVPKETVTLASNTSASGGKWVRSDAVSIEGTGILERFAKGMHNTVEFVSEAVDMAFYVKEIAFFTSEKQAYEYYGEDTPAKYITLSFGSDGNAVVIAGSNYGVSTINNETAALDIEYAESTNHGVNYMAKISFAGSAGLLSDEYRYVRVCYSAENPTGTSGADLFVRNDKTGERIALARNIENTNGKFVLSDTAYLSDGTVQRIMGKGEYSNPMHVSYCTTAALDGGTYSIKEIYFFRTRAEAEAFEIMDGNHTITIDQNDISKYSIVIPEGTHSLRTAADSLARQIEYLSGINVPIVYDTAPESEFEILLGVSSRMYSDSGISADDEFNTYHASIVENKLIVTAHNPYAVKAGVELMLSSCFYKGISDIPASISIDSDFGFSGTSKELVKYGKWSEITNVETPERFVADFETDDGYFTEENNADDWHYQNGEYTVNAAGKYALSYVHVYEANVKLGAKLKLTSQAEKGNFGVMLRYTAEDAYLKAGYDLTLGEWYIEYREGNDLALTRAAAKRSDIVTNKQYTVEFTADGDRVVLYVDGVQMLSAEGIHQITPGRIAVYAENVSISVDDIDALLMSGLGTVMRNVVHNRLPDEVYREGGSVMEMNDGTLVYETHHSAATFKSLDGGYTWNRAESQVFPVTFYPGYLRLSDGTWITAVKTTVNGKSCVISQTSYDDGKTWVDGGLITDNPYPAGNENESPAPAVNMNDKMTEMVSTGRIFYCQGYEVKDRSKPIDGRIVFCEFFYSDDKGATWNKSETSSWTIEGNETEAWFGECKILECADGTLRMYNSWNDYGCIVYSESHDMGVTWGPIVKLPEFICAKSSMQFCRDPYAENDTTYYMVWCNSEQEEGSSGSTATMTRARLSLAKTTDGKNWEYIGDLWHWRMNWRLSQISWNIMAHIVDPFITVTKDAVIVGAGIGEYLPVTDDLSVGHGAQRQHIWTISRETVDETAKPINRFNDIDLGAPYYDAVTYVTENNLFTGTSATTFEPATAMTRAMFVTVLGRLDGADVSEYTVPTFSDVIAGQWYTSYVEWAAANNIVNGLGNGLFGIDGTLTVEQACVMLARYANNKNTGASNGSALSSFSDAAVVSDWAKDGVEWALKNGIYAGQNGKLNPTSPASRALVATMFANYVTVFGE